MVKFPEAEIRLFKNKFICKKCKSSIRAPNQMILQGKIVCKKCHCKAFRTVRKK